MSEMTENNTTPAWQKTAKSVTPDGLVNKIIEEIESAVDDCDSDGYAELKLIIKGDKEEIVKIMEDCFEEWNNNNSVYTVSFERASEIYGVKDAYAYHFELSREKGDDDCWDNDFNLTIAYFVGEILQECDLPVEPEKPRKRPINRLRNGVAK